MTNKVMKLVSKKRRVYKKYKNSSGDEIANVNVYAVRPGSYPNSLK